MPKVIFAPTPPRRTSNSSTKKDKEMFSIEPATIESANRPGNVIK